MKVSDSKWSDKFSLDTVGSTGTTTCKSDSVNYQVFKVVQTACTHVYIGQR